MRTGQVILVGAGPGDPSLLTLKGRQAIAAADVVIYDRLVSPEILRMIPAHAECINVGKEASHHRVPQEQIQQILLEKARKGKRVVRLKGGDPFLFGRGGEELEFLAQHDIDFQEIPGVTSAIAVPAYAGIPVTHRDFCSSLHVITGHQRMGKQPNIAFDALVKAGGTLVFLMGVHALHNICEGLLQAGMSSDMPAAIMENGTVSKQRTIQATLSTLEQKAEAAKVESPSVIVIGGVCSLAKKLNWFDHLPLKNRKIIVTRPKERAGTLSERLRALGADVTEFPCIETIPYTPCPEMEEAILHIDTYAWLVFTSPAGVSTLMDWVYATNRDVRVLGRIRLAAIGPGTDRELRKYGLCADLIPDVYDGAHLAKALCKAQPTGKVLILRAQWGTPALTDILAQADIAYDDIRCYETKYTCPNVEDVRQLLLQEDAPMVTFTSTSTVRGFVSAIGDIPHEKITAVCLGKQTEEEAQKYHLRTITAKEATMDALIARIVEGE